MSDDYFTFAKELVLSVGKDMERHKLKWSNQVKKSKSPDTFVDTWIAQHIKERFEERTGIPVYSESKDNPAERLTKRTFGWCDPVDGTRALTHDESTYAISLGLIRNDSLLWGVVYMPHDNEQKMFSANRGHGAFVSNKGGYDKKIHVSRGRNLRGILGNTFQGQTSELFSSQGVEGVGPFGGFVYKVCMIADGSAEGYIKPGTKCNEWDSLAAHIILEEAGGKITDVDNNPLIYNKLDPRHRNGIVASNGTQHQIFLELCQILSR